MFLSGIFFFLPASQSEFSLASQEELTEVINFLSGAPIKLRLLNDEEANQSLVESHVTPVDSGLGSILSVSMSGVTQPSAAPANAPNEQEAAGDAVTSSCEDQSEAKKSGLPDSDDCPQPSNTAVPVGSEKVAAETQTSPLGDVSPVALFAAANAGHQAIGYPMSAASEEQEQELSSGKPDTEAPVDCTPPSKHDCTPNSDSASAGSLKKITPQPAPASAQAPPRDENDSSSTTDPNTVSEAETSQQSLTSDGSVKPRDVSSPVLVTVTSTEDSNEENAMSISESLR